MKLDCKETLIVLNAYIDSELTTEDSELVEEHIGRCESCQKELEDLTTASQIIKEWPPAETPAEFVHQIKKNIAQHSRPSFWNTMIPKSLLPLTFARQVGIVIILALIAVYISFQIYQLIGNPYQLVKAPVPFKYTSEKPLNPISEMKKENQTVQPKTEKSDNPADKQNDTKTKTPDKSVPGKSIKPEQIKEKLETSEPSASEIKIAEFNGPAFPAISPEATSTIATILPANSTLAKPESTDTTMKTQESVPAISKQIPGTPTDEVNTQPASEIKDEPTHIARINKLERHPEDLNLPDQIKVDIKEPAHKTAMNTITIPIKFHYKLEKPMIIIARLSFNSQKAPSKIEFLSKMKDADMRISLLRSLQNYDWKEFLIRNGLTGTTYKMDFILAKEGMILKNIKEKNQGKSYLWWLGIKA